MEKAAADDGDRRDSALARSKRYHPRGLGVEPAASFKRSGSIEGACLVALRADPSYVLPADLLTSRSNRRAYVRARRRAGLPAEFEMPTESGDEA